MTKGLSGKRIVLRKAMDTDLDAIYPHIYGDEELLSTMFLQLSPDRDSARERLRRTIAYQRDKELYFCALKDTDEVIGIGGMLPEGEGLWSEAGLAIGRDFQGKGYGTEMLALLLQRAFEDLNAAAFAYSCMEGNLRSKALAAHFGFVYEASRQETRERDGKTFTVCRFILTKEDYLANKYGFGRLDGNKKNGGGNHSFNAKE